MPRPNRVFGASGEEQVIRDGEREITLTNLRKTFWAREALTKGDLLAHYARVAPVLIPAPRRAPADPQALPDGADAGPFFQHNVPDNAPGLAGHRRALSQRQGRAEARTATWWSMTPWGCCGSSTSAASTCNPWQSRAATPDRPTHVLFDLDPMDGLAFERVVEAALAVGELSTRWVCAAIRRRPGARECTSSFPWRPGPDYATTRLFAQAVGEVLAASPPGLVITTEVRKAARGSRVYLDANQNGRGRSISSVYSVRPRRGSPGRDAPAVGRGRARARSPRRQHGRGRRGASPSTATSSRRCSADLQELAPAVARLAKVFGKRDARGRGPPAGGESKPRCHLTHTHSSSASGAISTASAPPSRRWPATWPTTSPNCRSCRPTRSPAPRTAVRPPSSASPSRWATADTPISRRRFASPSGRRPVAPGAPAPRRRDRPRDRRRARGPRRRPHAPPEPRPRTGRRGAPRPLSAHPRRRGPRPPVSRAPRRAPYPQRPCRRRSWDRSTGPERAWLDALPARAGMIAVGVGRENRVARGGLGRGAVRRDCRSPR